MGLMMSGGLILSFLALYLQLTHQKFKAWHWLFVIGAIFFVAEMEALSIPDYHKGNGLAAMYEHISHDDLKYGKKYPPEIYDIVEKYRKGCFSST